MKKKRKPVRREAAEFWRVQEFSFRLDLAAIVTRRIMTMPEIRVDTIGELSHVLGIKIGFETTPIKRKNP